MEGVLGGTEGPGDLGIRYDDVRFILACSLKSVVVCQLSDEHLLGCSSRRERLGTRSGCLQVRPISIALTTLG